MSVMHIVLCRKPVEGTVAANCLKHGTGGLNIDGCRVSYSESNPPIPQLAQGKLKVNSKKTMYDGQSMSKSKTVAVIGGWLDGRFPANVILSHHPECVCVGEKKITNKSGKASGKTLNDIGDGEIYSTAQGSRKEVPFYADSDGNETIEAWQCHEDCPIKKLDEQSGVTKSTGGSGDKSMGGLGKRVFGEYALDRKGNNIGGLGDTGGASRFFKNIQEE